MAHIISSDKKKRKITMNDVALEGTNKTSKDTKPLIMAKKNPDGTIRKINKLVDSEGKPIDGSSHFDTVENYNKGTKDVNDYIAISENHNKKVMGKIDKRYSTDHFVIHSDYVLVRCLYETLDIGGDSLLYASVPKFKFNTSTGIEEREKRYPYSNIGKLVNASKPTLEYLSNAFGQEVKIGDMVMIKPEVVQEVPISGRTKSESFLPQGFEHYGSKKISKADQVGYVIPRRFDVLALIKNI